MAIYKKDKDLYNIYENKKIKLTIEKIKKIADISQGGGIDAERQKRESRVIDNFFCFSEQPGILNNKGRNHVLIAGRGKYESQRIERLRTLLEGGVNVFAKDSIEDYDADNYYGMPTYDDVMSIWIALGRYIRNIFEIPTVCVTGSLGKTTTTQLTRAIFENEGKVFSTTGNLNTMDIIVTKMLREFNEEYEYIVQESAGGQIGLAEQAACALQPDIFCITNIKAHHLRGYGSIENILYDKTSFDRHGRSNTTIGVINGDDELLRNHDFQHKTVKCGIKNQDCDYVAKNIRQDGLKLNLEIWNEGNRYPISVNLLGEYNAYNVMFAFAIAKESGVEVENIISSLNGFIQLDRMRQFTQNIAGRMLIVDAFNTAVDSILGGCKILNDIEIGDPKAKKIAVIGSENRLGEKAFSINYKLGIELSKYDKIDKFIFYGNSPETSAKEAEIFGHTFAVYLGAKRGTEKAVYQWEPYACADMLNSETKPGDYIYFKGIFHKPMWAVIDKAFGTNYQFETKLSWAGAVRDKGFVATKVNLLDECIITSYKGDTNKITVPDVMEESAVHGINSEMFKEMTINSIDFGNSVMYIGNNCFERCSGITELTFPYSCKYIGEGAFSSCENLKSLIMRSVLTIGEGAFSNCRNLKEVVFHKDCYTVGKDAFENCPDLIIYGPKGSNIEKYAVRNGILFKDKEELSRPKKRMMKFRIRMLKEENIKASK